MCESAPSIVIVRHDFRPLRKVRRHHLVTEPLSCGVTTWQCHPSQPKLTSQPFRKGDKNVQTLQLNPICFLAHPQNPHEPNFGKGVFLPTKKKHKNLRIQTPRGLSKCDFSGPWPHFFPRLQGIGDVLENPSTSIFSLEAWLYDIGSFLVRRFFFLNVFLDI